MTLESPMCLVDAKSVSKDANDGNTTEVRLNPHSRTGLQLASLLEFPAEKQHQHSGYKYSNCTLLFCNQFKRSWQAEVRIEQVGALAAEA